MNVAFVLYMEVHVSVAAACSLSPNRICRAYNMNARALRLHSIAVTLTIPRVATNLCPIRGALARLSARSKSWLSHVIRLAFWFGFREFLWLRFVDFVPSNLFCNQGMIASGACRNRVEILWNLQECQ